MNSVRSPKHHAVVTVLATTILALAAYSGLVLGDDIQVTLSGDQEVPAVKTAAKGAGTITINADQSVSGSVTTSGVAGTMAHIHMAASGNNGPVILPLVKGGEGTWSVPAGAKLNDPQYAAYKAGQLYVNVHSAENKGGEIRGQLKP